MEKLEVLPSFKKRFAEKIKSSIQSIKYCQSTDKSVVEIKFANSNTVKSIDLKFMGGEIIKNEDDLMMVNIQPQDWLKIRNVFADAQRAAMHCSVSTISSDGFPTSSPIGTLFLHEYNSLILFVII